MLFVYTVCCLDSVLYIVLFNYETYTCYRSLRGDGSKKEVSEMTCRIKLTKTLMNNERLKKCRDAFDAFDIDNSGTINSDELKSVLEHIGISCSDLQVNSITYIYCSEFSIIYLCDISIMGLFSTFTCIHVIIAFSECLLNFMCVCV